MRRLKRRSQQDALPGTLALALGAVSRTGFPLTAPGPESTAGRDACLTGSGANELTTCIRRACRSTGPPDIALRAHQASPPEASAPRYGPVTGVRPSTHDRCHSVQLVVRCAPSRRPEKRRAERRVLLARERERGP